MKCLIDGRTVSYPCSPNCHLFGDCVVEFEKQNTSSLKIEDKTVKGVEIDTIDSQGCEYCDDPHPARDCVLDDGTEQMLVCYPDGTIWGKPFIHTRKINFCPMCGRNLFTSVEGE